MNIQSVPRNEVDYLVNLYALRHLRTNFNSLGIICGASPSIPIAEIHSIKCEEKFETVYCSNALRCKQTLSIFLESNEVDAVIYSSSIEERNMGDFEKKKRSELIAQYPDFFVGAKFDVFRTPPNGETYEMFYSRASEFLCLLQKMHNGNVLICSHNQFLKMLHFLIYNPSFSISEWSEFNYPNGVVVRL